MTKHIYQDDFDFEYHDYSTEAEKMEKERQKKWRRQKAQKEAASNAKLTIIMIFFTIGLFYSLQGAVILLRRLLGL